MSDINFFGQTTFRGENKKFGIKIDDRRRHFYVIGKTGMGKTEMIKNMIIQDIEAGRGVGLVDPHGEAAEEIIDFIPKERIKDVVYFNPSDINHPIAFNIMENVNPEHRHLVSGGLMGVFKKIWPDVWSSRMEYILNNAILSLLEIPGSTLLGINRLLADAEYREKVISRVKDPVVKSFWTKEFARYNQRYETEATAAIQNKIGQFISTPLIRNIIGQPKSSIDIRKIMDEKKIMIMNLSKGRIGEDCSRLLGSLVITKLQMAAMSRVDMPEKERNDFFLYVDEFQNFATDSFASILSEARKYRLSLILAHQYIAQMEESVRDAVFGNIGTFVSFRVGADDAEVLEREFSPEFYVHDLVNLAKYNIYVKLMIEGVTSRPFSAMTLYPLPLPLKSYKEEIVEFSRKTYATERKTTEERIAKASQNNDYSKNDILMQSPVELYEAVCQSCSKKVKVPFKPDGKRVILCKSCLKKKEKEEEEKKLAGHSGVFSDLLEVSLKTLSKEEEKKEEKKKEKKTKKQTDLTDLKSLLREAKNNKKEPSSKTKKDGNINPGECIKF